jgi:hypothetical protein
MRWRADFMRAKEGPGDAVAVLKRFGALALQTPADTQETRRNMIAAGLPTQTWPDRCLLIVAVEWTAASGACSIARATSTLSMP